MRAPDTLLTMPEVLQLSGMPDAESDMSMFENKAGLAEDMKFLASMPELCDVTFLVGETKEPVCAVKVKLNHLIKHIINFILICISYKRLF